MESSWSVGMNMTYWVENRKKESRNEIKVEADEPDVRKTESIPFGGKKSPFGKKKVKQSMK